MTKAYSAPLRMSERAPRAARIVLRFDTVSFGNFQLVCIVALPLTYQR